MPYLYLVTYVRCVFGFGFVLVNWFILLSVVAGARVVGGGVVVVGAAVVVVHAIVVGTVTGASVGGISQPLIVISAQFIYVSWWPQPRHPIPCSSRPNVLPIRKSQALEEFHYTITVELFMESLEKAFRK